MRILTAEGKHPFGNRGKLAVAQIDGDVADELATHHRIVLEWSWRTRIRDVDRVRVSGGEIRREPVEQIAVHIGFEAARAYGRDIREKADEIRRVPERRLII